MVRPVSGGAELVYEPMAFCFQNAEPPGANPVTGIPVYTNYVKLADRRIYMSGGQMYGVADGITTPEGPDLGWYTGGDLVHPGRNNQEVFVTGTHVGTSQDFKEGRFYDTVAKTYSTPYYIGMACSRLLFVPEFGVMLSCHADDPEVAYPWVIRVWSLEVQPTIISPVTVANGVPKSGQVVTYQVQVTGAQNEPAEGELVDWSLGSPSVGFLLDVQSKTDAMGVAKTKVQYLVGETGESVVTASVQC